MSSELEGIEGVDAVLIGVPGSIGAWCGMWCVVATEVGVDSAGWILTAFICWIEP